MEEINNKVEEIRLTQLSHGAGCGCKISPEILEGMIKEKSSIVNPLLLVGNRTNDDAAVYDIGNGQAIISTTDFFMPIVDNPEDFGAIASVNAMSDIYAMGGTPLLAIAILGWPVDKVDPAIAGRVLEGARGACFEAGIEIAGGHSIDNPEPIFGLAVTGIVEKKHLKRNDSAKPGSLLYLTKPLGVGLVTTAQKSGIAYPDDIDMVTKSMKTLNQIGKDLGMLEFVNAMTDVTGFGLLGHLTEICQGSGVSAEINYMDVPKIANIDYYLDQKTAPGGTMRNWNSYKHKIAPMNPDWINLLADPQTSGGLLISVDENKKKEFEDFMNSMSFIIKPFGKIIGKSDYLVKVN